MSNQQLEVEPPITIFTTSVAKKRIEKQDRRSYQRITEPQRVALLEKILQEKKKIIKAALEVGVNYSTAKAVLKMYRKNQHLSSFTSQKSNAQCNYLNFPAYFLTNCQQINVVSSVGGQVQEKDKRQNENFQEKSTEEFIFKDQRLLEPLFLRKVQANFYSLFQQFVRPDRFSITS